MSIENLRKILPVPGSPIDTDESFLSQNQMALGTDFPQDYLEFSRVYGSGAITTVYRWEIYSAFRPTLPDMVKFFHDRNKEVNVSESGKERIRLFPMPDELLPFGRDDDLYFTWRTSGKPDDWRVVVFWRCSPGGHQEFDLGFTEFLVRLLNRSISVEGYSLAWDPDADILFESKVFS